MKAFRILTAVVSFGVILIINGCGGKSTPAESTQEKQLKLLTQTWKISTVTLDGTDQSTINPWTGFQLTISGDPTAATYNYSCANRAKIGPWQASGTWKFGTDPVTQIIRIEDNLIMTYTVTATTLQLNFNYSGNGYTRVNNVTGNWVFNFTL
jgi:hypothetical protein